MVLSLLRRKARSTFIYVAFGIIIVVFIFYFGWGTGGPDRPETWAAKVDGRPIEYNTYLNYYKRLVAFYREQYKDALDPEVIEQLGLKEQALETVIRESVVGEAAQNMGISVPDTEIQESIRTMEAFQTGGAFDLQKYRQLLKSNRVQPGEFERSQSREIMIRRVQELVESGAKFTDRELWDLFVYEDEKVRLEYLEIDPQKMVAEEAVKTEDAEAYYEQNKERFRVAEKSTVAYIEFSPQTFKDTIEISEKEIEDYYGEYSEEFWEPEKVRARHILVRVDAGAKPEDKERARKKAEDILAKVKAGGDFAELAKEFSEDKGSAGEGGDLGFFQRGQMVGPFEDASFGLEPGTVSDLVETPFGFHIIKVEAKTPEGTKPLEQVRDDIGQELFDAKAAEAIRKEAFRAYRSTLKDKELTAYAEENGFTVVTTAPFSREEGHAIFAEAPDALSEAFSVDLGEMIYPFSAGKTYYVAKAVQKYESHVPPFAEAKSGVEAILQEQQRKEGAHKKAQALLAAAKQAGTLEAEAAREGLELKNTPLFSRSGRFVPGFGRSPETLITAFSLTPENPYPDDVFEQNGKYYVFRLLSKEKALREDFVTKREELRKRQLNQKKNQYLAAWVDFATARSNVVRNPKILQ